MDGELLQHLYHELFHVGKPHRPTRCTYGDNIILFMFFVAVVADRSLRWAHDRRNWPLWARRLPRPSYSQFKRRVKTDSIRKRIADVNRALRDRLPLSTEKFLDGKPLIVGVFSKAPDAAWGRLSNKRWAKGYKVHVLADWTGVIEAFDVTPLNTGEPTTAREIVAAQDLDGAVVYGDAAYDSNALYETIATRGGRLIAPRKRPGSGLGHHPQHPDRLRAIAELEGAPRKALPHRRRRIRVEQVLAHLTNLPFGLTPLPNCVRRLDRVRRWIEAKILLYHEWHCRLQLSPCHVFTFFRVPR